MGRAPGLQSVACVAIGGLLGYVAANDGFNLSDSASASRAAQDVGNVLATQLGSEGESCCPQSSQKELTFLDFPPMQRGASFNLDAVKAEMAKRMAQAGAASKGPGQ